MLVKSWMKTDPKVLKASDSLQQAKELMDTCRFRRVPVVDDSGLLVGIISRHDIHNAMPSVVDGSDVGSSMVIFDSSTIADVMTTNPVSFNVMTPLEYVAREMKKNKFGGAPVVENGKVVGIITESDIFSAFIEVMGGEREGLRLELLAGKSPRDFYRVIRMFERYDVEVRSFSLHYDFSDTQHLITARVFGQDYEELLDALRAADYQVHKISSEKWP